METTTAEERPFWRHVDRSDPAGCHPWVGPGSRGRYGHDRIWWEGRRVYVHRLAFLLSGGVMEKGNVLHTCDRGECCNPEHLVDGTLEENNRQRDERNRRTPYLPRGRAHWSPKLDETTVRALRVGRGERVKAKALAAMYGISLATVYNVWAGVHYPATEGDVREPEHDAASRTALAGAAT